MRNWGLLVAIVGVAIVGVGIYEYFAEHTGIGIACMAAGVCLLGIGVMMFLSGLLIQATNRTANLLIRFEFFRLKAMLQGELGKPDEEVEQVEEGKEATGSKRSLE